MAQKSPLTLFDFHKQFRDEEDCKEYGPKDIAVLGAREINISYLW
jgi:hypothetical protein